MSSNGKIKFTILGAALLLVIAFVGHTISAKLALRKYDAAYLTSFAHRIADSDHIVGTFKDSKISSTITGGDVQKVVRAVASASSIRSPGDRPLEMLYDVKTVFYKGTNVLGDIEIGEGIFLIDGSENIPFVDSTGLLKDLVWGPAYKAYRNDDQASNKSAVVSTLAYFRTDVLRLNYDCQ